MTRQGLKCSLCDVTFDTTEQQRQHAKSKSHVENLRNRVVASGMSSLPTPDNYRDSIRTEDQSSQSDTDAEDEAKEDQILEFQPQNCIFCPKRCTSFDDSLDHMRATHGFTIPYQANLAVESVTLIWYLYFVISSYHECISCRTRRRTIEGVQQHMLDKGHCRFEMSDEMMEFYDLEGVRGPNAESLVRPDEESLRLPSGSIISHRHQTPSSTKQRSPNRQTTSSEAGQEALPGHAPSDVLTTRDSKAVALAAQLSRLSAKDQQSLIHLPESAQRSLLVQRKKEFDTARRAERRMLGKTERLSMGQPGYEHVNEEENWGV
ncbi:C2H2 type zinc-finger-domain-containing protein [Mariannaea sp. PMI_226]|nr:C2H2 type zinc-finger-domain-containing protein [Mariannaea sp. PMI_226]